jgi:hypothetical protein
MRGCSPVAVHAPPSHDRRLVSARDAAHGRVRRATGLLLAAAIAAAGTLAAYVSSAASGRKASATTTAQRPATHATVTQVPVPAVPAAPSLHVSPSPPVQAPLQSVEPPVAVSGGS